MIRAAAAVLVVLNLLAILPALGLLTFSVFLFDAPGSEDNGLLWAIVGGLLAAPVLFVGGAVAGVRAFRKVSKRAAVLSAVLLVAPVAFVGLNFALLDVYCKGELACGKDG